MKFVDLVVHGLSAISVFGEVAGVRVMLLAFGLSALLLASTAVLILLRAVWGIAGPAWLPYAGLVLVLVLLQMVGVVAGFVFSVLGAKSNPGFIPLRDAHTFIEDVVPFEAGHG
jgi:hypothetical protein